MNKRETNPHQHCFFSDASYNRHTGTGTASDVRRSDNEHNVIMKKLISIFTASLVLAVASMTQAAIIADWNFEVSPTPGDTTSTSVSSGVADTGDNTSGSAATGLHASSSSVWTFGNAGNGSSHSFSVNHWAVGDYFQFKVSTIGYQNIMVAFSAFGSGTGPRDFKIAYSTDGTSFTDFNTYSVVATPTWNTTTHQTTSTENFSFDFSSFTSLNNDSDIYFRLLDTSTVSIGGGTVGTAGTSRVDDFAINGDLIPVPEPTTYAEIIFGVLFCGTQVARKIRSRARA